PLCAAIGMIFQVGYVTVVPALSGPARITEANGLLYAAQSAAAVAGPLLAGLISAVLGPANAIAVDAASFAVSAAGVLVVRHGLASRRGETTDSSGGATPEEPVSASPDTAGAWRELLAGARF